MALKKIAAAALIAITAFFLFATGLTCSGMVHAKAPESTTTSQIAPQSLLPQTYVVAVLSPQSTATDARACDFTANYMADLGYPVKRYCGHAVQSPSLPRPGDSVLFFYFGESFSEKWVRENVPVEQTAGGSVAVFPKLVEDASLASGGGAIFNAVFTLKGGSSENLAQVAIRCAIEQGTNTLSLDEVTSCWSRLHAETSSQGTRIEGDWEHIIRGANIYPPRGGMSGLDRGAARALLAYDKRVYERRASAPVTEAGSRKPLENWGAAKHTLVWGGAATGIGCGIASAVTYSKGVSLNQDIGNGVYGFVGDATLEEAVEDYNALGKRLPLLLGCAGAGAAATTVGILLPTKKNNPSVAVSPTRITVTGRF